MPKDPKRSLPWLRKDRERHRDKRDDAKKVVEYQQEIIRRRNEQIERLKAAKAPLRLRAHAEAEKWLGVVEVGGNNTGPVVDRIIRENGGVIGEPWCGDFMAFVYRNAGSEAVDRSWASVRLTGADPDVHQMANPERGDLVRFTFDHIGMFERDNEDGTITTIEGNTGSTGAVSDSRTGGDGVYRKVRAKSLVADYLRVER